MDQYSTQHSTEDALYNPGLNPSRCLAQRNRSTTSTGACVTPLLIGFLEASPHYRPECIPPHRPKYLC